MTIPPAGYEPPAARAFSIEEALTALIVGGELMGAAWPATWTLGASTNPSTDSSPDTLLLDGHQLATLRRWLREPEDKSLVLAASLRSLASAAASEPLWSVVDKSSSGPSGDIHDYVSFARYWWPNPETEDGLPHVRRDGEVNPDSQSDDTDSARLAQFTDGVLALALCGYLLDEPDWSGQARKRLLVWIVEPRTRQNPNFDYAQLIKGRSGVRAPAVVDARRMLASTEAFRLLRWQGVFLPAEEQAVLDWFGELLEWLVTSPEGEAAAQARNNVAAWCALERVVLADLVGNKELTSASLRWAGTLLADQVEPDGALPAELTRQNPANYLAFAFVALALLARVGEERGHPLWDRTTGDGRGLAVTREWLAALSSVDHAQRGAPTPTVMALAMRLLTWREDTYLGALRRASQLENDVGQRDSQVARLLAQNIQIRSELETLRGRKRKTLRDPEPVAEASRALAQLRGRARQWRAIGPAGRKAKKLWRNYRWSDGGHTLPRAAHGPSPGVEQRLIREYEAAELSRRPLTFVLYRILGNDLPPRHKSGQTVENVRFILEHEPNLVDCEKRWILNRIVDPRVEQDLLDLLRAHGQPVLRLPYEAREYARQPFDFNGFPRPDYLTTKAWEQSRADMRARAVSAAYRRKNLYVMNNNAARNTAIDDGRARATWILPFDGSIFVGEEAWTDIRSAVLARPHLPYLVVPMVRTDRNDLVLSPEQLSPAEEEPQVAFRSDAQEAFDECRPYGRRPKVELLWRLGVPGAWQRWSMDPWDPPAPPPAGQHGCFHEAGQVVRLAADDTTMHPGTQNLKERGSIRETAIVGFLRSLDGAVARDAWAGGELAFYDEQLLDEVASGALRSGSAAILAQAELALLRGPFSVTDKTGSPPSGDPHDYWHPAPYWWPDPFRPSGIPYRRLDGRRMPGTEMFSAGSEQFDRTRLHLMLSDVTALALAWRVSGDDRFARHGADEVRTWFVNDSTAMTPRLEYAQVRRGHDGDRGQASGIIELKDLYYFLDAVRLLGRSGLLTVKDQDHFGGWLTSYLEWLLGSPQGREEKLSANNHGTCYDLQVMAIATFLKDGGAFADASLRAQGRMRWHFDAIGRQREELTRTETRHYCAFNLQSWVNLARIAENGGLDLWRDDEGRVDVLGRGLDWYLAMQGGEGWPFRQEQRFDARRDGPLESTVRLLRQPRSDAREIASTTDLPWVLHPHDGAAPFWPLGLGPRHRTDANWEVRKS